MQDTNVCQTYFNMASLTKKDGMLSVYHYMLCLSASESASYAVKSSCELQSSLVNLWYERIFRLKKEHSVRACLTTFLACLVMGGIAVSMLIPISMLTYPWNTDPWVRCVTWAIAAASRLPVPSLDLTQLSSDFAPSPFQSRGFHEVEPYSSQVIFEIAVLRIAATQFSPDRIGGTLPGGPVF